MTFRNSQSASGRRHGIEGKTAAHHDRSLCSDFARTCQSWTDADDQLLMQGIAAGASEALEALYDRYSDRVHNLCRRVLDHDDSAEDAVIDTFWDLWQRPQRYDPARGTVLTYMLMLARCRAIDRRRSAGARQRLHQAIGAADPEQATLPAHAESPRITGDIDDSEAVAAVFDRLEPRCRDAVRLCIVQGMTARQASTLLRVPLGTIKSRIRKGIIQMREQLRTHSGKTDAAQGASMAD